MQLLHAPPMPPLPGTGSKYPTTVRGPLPKLDMPVPTAVSRQLRDAVERGRRDAAEWLRAHPDGSDADFQAFVVERVGTAPGADVERRELQVVRDAAASRTAAGLRDAAWVDVPGLFALWNRYASQYYRSASTADAQRGAALVAETDRITSQVTFAIKGDGRRERPFTVDPQGAPLAPGIRRVHGSSWPSGHSSRAWSSAVVLGELMPSRAQEFAAAAEQVAWGRVYAAAHFPSDVAAGAYIGAAAATWALQRTV